MPEIALVVIDPGHFHAALLQKEMHSNVAREVQVYAPVGPELVDYLQRIARFNTRQEQPTRWALEVHASDDFLERAWRERPGKVAIFAGRNRGKIQRIQAAIEAGMHVLADKPLLIRSEDLPMLDAALQAAEARGLVLRDLMSGRHDTVNTVQAALHGDPEVFGEPLAGTPGEPGVVMTSVHHILKEVSGAPNPRPPWFFDVTQQGEALSDIGTHLVDRVHRTLFPEQALKLADLETHAATRWPTSMTAAQFRHVTGEASWPDYLRPAVRGDALDYFCNTRFGYRVRGIEVGLDLRWDWEAQDGGDTHTAVYRGSRARLELRQGAAERHRPELYVVPLAGIEAALRRRIDALCGMYPGLALERRGSEWRVMIPDSLRHGHDAHFVTFARNFFREVERGTPLPRWEGANLLVKYHLTTRAGA